MISLNDIVKMAKEQQCEITATVQPDGTEEVVARPWHPTRYRSVSEDLPQVEEVVTELKAEYIAEGSGKYLKQISKELAQVNRNLDRIGGRV